MAVRIGQTRNAAPRLLRTVGGKPHASKQDHEEAHNEKDSSQEGLRLDDWDELELGKDPVSSDDEALRAPPKPSKPTSDSNTLRQPSSSTRKRKAEAPLPEPEPGLREPAKSKTQLVAPRVPKHGQFAQNRAAKEGPGLEGDKENKNTRPTPPSSSQDIWGFGISSQTSQKGKAVKFGGAKKKTINIHVNPSTTKNSRPAKAASKANQKKEHSWDVKPDDDSDSDTVSMLSEALGDEELEALIDSTADKPDAKPEDPELRKVEPKKRPARTTDNAPESSALDEAELDILLKPTLRDHLGISDQLPDSSLPDSSAPQEEMDDIDSYMRELPVEAEEGTECAICHEPVNQDDYWDFWKGRKKTVKNQAAFCFAHKKKTAQKECDAEGYPTIDWAALPLRIKKHRMDLHRILTNDLPSAYRTRYEPLALTGKAAAVPSKRTDLPTQQQAQLESYALDDNAVCPGYYGPRGRRAITESVMRMLRNEIKRCVDPVVQTSGPATFVQAVLVPEVAVRLIMEDVVCDRDEAEEVRERTWEMGVLLNEEIEDEVEVGEESDGDNEYHL